MNVFKTEHKQSHSFWLYPRPSTKLNVNPKVKCCSDLFFPHLVFLHGQLFVASKYRVRSFDGLRFYIKDSNRMKYSESKSLTQNRITYLVDCLIG